MKPNLTGLDFNKPKEVVSRDTELFNQLTTKTAEELSQYAQSQQISKKQIVSYILKNGNLLTLPQDIDKMSKVQLFTSCRELAIRAMIKKVIG